MTRAMELRGFAEAEGRPAETMPPPHRRQHQ